MSAPMPSQLVRLIYRSRSALEGTASDLERDFAEILGSSRRRNAADGVTGALMFTRLLFVQALEGPADIVEEAFERICSDLRHTGVEIVEYGPVPQRGFGDWSMSHLVPNGPAAALLDSSASDSELVDAAASALKLMAALLCTSDRSASAPQSGDLPVKPCASKVRNG